MAGVAGRQSEPGFWEPSLPCGRRSLYSQRKSSMTTRASVSVQSRSWLRYLSRKRPWKLLTKPFCHGLSGVGVDRLDLVGCQPRLQFFGDELRAVVATEISGRAVGLDHPLPPSEHDGGTQGAIRAQHMTLVGVLIQDGQHLECPAAHGGIADEVPSLDMAAVRGFSGQPCGDAPADDLAFGQRHA